MTMNQRMFSSGEECLYAIKEDLAEWLSLLYPSMLIDADTFISALETGEYLVQVGSAAESGRYLITEYIY